MSVTGKVKLQDQEDLECLCLTPEQAGELRDFLNDAIETAEGDTDDKKQGMVTLAISEKALKIGTSKVRRPKEEDDD